MAANFDNYSVLGHLDRSWPEDSIWNESNVTHHDAEKENHPSEGGILSGHGPLDTPLARFLVQAVIIIGLSRFLHIFLAKLRQPRVIAEMIGGICLGPSILGNIPGFTEAIFPVKSLDFLTTVSNIGLVFYLFLVGLELEPNAFFNEIRRSAAISLAGIVLPFGVGVACSWGLFKYLLVPNIHNIPFTSFMLFAGVSMSITAFPVLARILTEKKLLQTPVGLISISAAAIDDAMAWTLLALVISILNAGDNLTALYVFLLALGYALLLLVLLRPLLGKLFDRFLAKSSNPVSQFLVAAVFICIFLSAWITEMIGVHAIFGAFLFGLVIPRSHNMAIRLTEKIEDVIIIGFLPLFFASSGLKTNIGLLNDGMTWAWLFVVIVVACFGKMVGCSIAARLAGIPWRESVNIGVLMNTRGLIQLIVLNIGYQAKVINDRIFLIMVIMALVTTFITSPIVSWLYPPKYQRNLTRKKTRLISVAVPTNVDLSSRRQSMAVEQIRVLVCIDELHPIPTIAKLLWLFKVDDNKDDFVINTLKIVETSERSSSIMIASQIAEAIKSDPGLNMMSLFGSLINVNTRSFMSLSPVGDISDEVNYVASNEECNLIVLPWFEQSVVGSILSSSPQEKIRSIVTTATATTAVYVPQRVNVFGSEVVAKNILVPFYGATDDCEAVKIALRFYRHGNVKVTILKIDYATNVGGPVGSKVSVTSANGHFVASGLHIVGADTDAGTVLEEIRRAVATSVRGNFVLKEIATPELTKCVIDECRQGNYDMVLVGRNFNIVIDPLSGGSLRNIPAVIDSVTTTTTNSDSEQKFENGSAFKPTFHRSNSDNTHSSMDKIPPRSMSFADRMNTAADHMATYRTRHTIVTEILGQLGEILYELDLASVLVVHRNTNPAA